MSSDDFQRRLEVARQQAEVQRVQAEQLALNRKNQAEAERVQRQLDQEAIFLNIKNSPQYQQVLREAHSDELRQALRYIYTTIQPQEWYNVETWFGLGKTQHKQRLLPFEISIQEFLHTGNDFPLPVPDRKDWDFSEALILSISLTAYRDPGNHHILPVTFVVRRDGTANYLLLSPGDYNSSRTGADGDPLWNPGSRWIFPSFDSVLNRLAKACHERNTHKYVVPKETFLKEKNEDWVFVK